MASLADRCCFAHRLWSHQMTPRYLQVGKSVWLVQPLRADAAGSQFRVTPRLRTGHSQRDGTTPGSFSASCWSMSGSPRLGIRRSPVWSSHLLSMEPDIRRDARIRWMLPPFEKARKSGTSESYMFVTLTLSVPVRVLSVTRPEGISKVGFVKESSRDLKRENGHNRILSIC